MRGTPRESQLTDPEDRRRLVGTKEGQVGSNPRGVKGGKVYPFRSAFCMETQHYPDSPNKASFPTTVLKPGTTYHTTTIYRFAAR